MDIKFLLFYRWLCINALGFALLGVAYLNGWVGIVLSGDITHMVVVIMATFLWGFLLCGWRVWETSKELNYVKSGYLKKSKRWQNYVALKAEHEHKDPTSLIEALKIRIFSKIASIKYIANTLVLMGLVGTVLGFIIALSGVNPTVVQDVTAIAPMVGTLIQGMSVALYTTLVGAIANIWLMLNYNLLANGTAKLITSILEARVNV